MELKMQYMETNVLLVTLFVRLVKYTLINVNLVRMALDCMDHVVQAYLMLFFVIN